MMDKYLKKYLYLTMLSVETITLTSCGNFKDVPAQHHEITLDNQDENIIEPEIDDEAVEKFKEKHEKVKKAATKKIEDKYDKIKRKIETSNIKEKASKEFINIIEFIAGNRTINGVYFNELDDKAKAKIKKIAKKLDKKIEEYYPNYKDSIKDKYKSVKNYMKENGVDEKVDKIKEKTNDAKDYVKKKIGEGNIEKVKDKVEDIFDKGKSKIKKCYKNFKKKHE